MRKLAVCLALLVLVPAFAASTGAQEAAQPAKSVSHAEAAGRPAHFYRLAFVLEELDSGGKPVNSRSFTTIVSTAGTRAGSFSVGTKIPVATGTQSPSENPNNFSTQFQYIDVGVKIKIDDTHEEGSNIAFGIVAEVSSLATPTVIAGVSEPVLRENVWSGDVLIPVGKPATVFKSDSLENKGSMQLEVTATPVD